MIKLNYVDLMEYHESINNRFSMKIFRKVNIIACKCTNYNEFSQCVFWVDRLKVFVVWIPFTNIQLSKAKLCFVFTSNNFYFRIYPLKLFNGELTLFIHPITKVNKIFVSCFTRSHFHAISEFIPFKFIFLHNSCICHIEHFFVKIFSWQILTQDGVIRNTIAHCRYIDCYV